MHPWICCLEIDFDKKGFGFVDHTRLWLLSAVAETSSGLVDQVVSDPSTSQGHIKESLKAKLGDLKESGEGVINKSEATGQAIDSTKEFAHKVNNSWGVFRRLMYCNLNMS